MKKGMNMNSMRKNDWFPGLLDMFFTDDVAPLHRRVSPALNILESEDEYTVELAAPGLTKSDFEIHVDDSNILTISMEKQTMREESPETEEKSESKDVAVPQHKPARYLRREFSSQSFEQKLVLPEDVVVDEISALVENGVLTVKVPKMKPEQKVAQHRKIDIR